MSRRPNHDSFPNSSAPGAGPDRRWGGGAESPTAAGAAAGASGIARNGESAALPAGGAARGHQPVAAERQSAIDEASGPGTAPARVPGAARPAHSSAGAAAGAQLQGAGDQYR